MYMYSATVIIIPSLSGPPPSLPPPLSPQTYSAATIIPSLSRSSTWPKASTTSRPSQPEKEVSSISGSQCSSFCLGKSLKACFEFHMYNTTCMTCEMLSGFVSHALQDKCTCTCTCKLAKSQLWVLPSSEDVGDHTFEPL